MTTFEEVKDNIQLTMVDPLLALRAKIGAINALHNHNLTQFKSAMNGLLTGSDGEAAFQGQGSLALADMLGNYLTATQALSGSGSDTRGSDLDGHMLLPVSIGEKSAHQISQQLAHLVAQGPPHEMLDGVALAAGAGAVAQGGLDVPWDIVAGVLIVGALAYRATANPDQARINEAATEAMVEVQSWRTQVQPDFHPPELPESPQGPKGDFNNFLVAIGAAIIIGGSLVAIYNVAFKDLPAEQQAKTLQSLSEKYGCSSAELKAILDKYGSQISAQQLEYIVRGLSIKAQLEELLNEVENSPIKNTDSFKKILRDLIESIKKRIKNGSVKDWDYSKITTWENNLKGYQYQWEAARDLNATSMEYPIQTTDVDITTEDAWYELKNTKQPIYRGSDTFTTLVKQLKKYFLAGQNEIPPITKIGAIIPDNPDNDPNLGQELEDVLRGEGINTKVEIINRTWKPSIPRGTGWCKL